MSHPDQKYIDALLKNNTVVLRELYRNFSAKIKWMVLKNNGTEEEAWDLIQESLLAIYRRALKEDFVLTCPFDAYFYMVCRKKWLNVLAKRKSDKTVTIEEDIRYNFEDDSFRLAEESIIEEERRQLLLQKIQELGAACRELLELSWSEKSMEEVAAILNYTYGYARKKKSECMAKLIQSVKQSPVFQKLEW